jgi:hypothetical protein
MTSLWQTPVAALAVGAVILLQAQDCGEAVTVIQHYDSETCALSSVPASVDRPPYRVSSHVPEVYSHPRCPGFTVYGLRDRDTKEQMFFDVRLNRGPSCGIDVGYSYISHNEYDNEQMEKRVTPLAEVMAALLLQDADAPPRLSASKTQRFSTFRTLRDWCVRTNSAARAGGQ